MLRLGVLCFLLSLCLQPEFALPQDASSNSQAASADRAAPATTARRTSGASGAEIAAAKASHKVWVNLDSGIYHKSGRWYGKTKNGKFMTEEEAKKAGYRRSKRQ